MNTPAPAETKLSARDRLLAAATELFYEEGVQTVGIDRIIERAGVAKASLYKSFGSKDELIRAYLQGQHTRRQALIEQELATLGSPRAKLLGIFDLLEVRFGAPGFRGCAFINASAETHPGSPVAQASDDYRSWSLGLFRELATQIGAKDPAKLARQLQLLYDGAAVSARMDHEFAAVVAAREAAEALLDATLPVHA